ncbi:hypothetical protein SPBR_00680 [Sporothrix brasiliensis 5110]|uniref:2EXR domain-containing protein n=1 Tax=Sporothrix brasiliensis 5110 TaxID=1398154 RepID=A0A0C2ETM2_9PEZI|nr:uncharacterized protein SPBR_00680 [Sporothrix brasiliensis 5110]KIH89869.1 hypothetical protein SPBR_00680 [Sporothrix brasiliensis 5110]
MAGPSTASTTPRITFSSLPAEIRSAIWTEALPRRVIGLRPFEADDDEYAPSSAPQGDSVAVVSARARASVGSRMPQAMASTCFESRAAALRSGRWTVGAEGQPQAAGRLHAAGPGEGDGGGRSRTPADTNDHEGDHDHDDVAVWRVSRAAPPLAPRPPPPGPAPIDPASTVSIADLAHHQLVGCLDEAVRGGGGIAVKHELLQSQVGAAIFPLLQRCAAAAAQRGGARSPSRSPAPPPPPPPQLLVYFDEIVLTGTRAQAVASGLFGSAAAPEEHMFFVPLSDRAALQRIHALCRARRPASAASADTAREGRAHLQGSLGGLRIGNAGFVAELLRPSHTVQNLRILAMRFLYHAKQWRADMSDEAGEVLIARALEAGMPPLEQAILFRFKEAPAFAGSEQWAYERNNA